MVTEESMPVTKTKDDPVIGGRLIEPRSLASSVQKVGDETMLSRIVQMVADAQRSRAPSEWLTAFQAGLFLW